jgi:Rrf2 family nitric oxide-sensitive transcriptional repressor
MQLTLYSDYSLRVLFYLSNMQKETATITEISTFYDISRNHLVKVVHRLAQLGFIISLRGKGGGIKLAKNPQDIKIGEVVRKTEPNYTLVECFNEKTNRCVIANVCRLKRILNEGLEAFLNVLDQYTIADSRTKGLAKQIKLSIMNLHKMGE